VTSVLGMATFLGPVGIISSFLFLSIEITLLHLTQDVLQSMIIATIIAVYGLLIPPISWSLALFVWAYAMVAFVLTDLAKVFLFKRFEGDMNILEIDAIAVEREVKMF
jgi:H+-transporting ATPase